VQKVRDGRIVQWAIGELSLIDTTRPGHQPANPQAVVFAKSLYVATREPEWESMEIKSQAQKVEEYRRYKWLEEQVRRNLPWRQWLGGGGWEPPKVNTPDKGTLPVRIPPDNFLSGLLHKYSSRWRIERAKAYRAAEKELAKAEKQLEPVARKIRECEAELERVKDPERKAVLRVTLQQLERDAFPYRERVSKLKQKMTDIRKEVFNVWQVRLLREVVKVYPEVIARYQHELDRATGRGRRTGTRNWASRKSSAAAGSMPRPWGRRSPKSRSRG